MNSRDKAHCSYTKTVFCGLSLLLIFAFAGCELKIVSPENEATVFLGESAVFEAEYESPENVHWGYQVIAYDTSPDLSQDTNFVEFDSGRLQVVYLLPAPGRYAIIAA